MLLTVLRDGVLHRIEPGGTSLLFDTLTGDVHTLNPTGTIALQQILAGGTTQAAADILSAEFDVTVDQAKEDVETLMTMLGEGDFLSQV